MTSAQDVQATGVVICLAGDSGDGVQLAGRRLAQQGVAAGLGLGVAPDFPAEIRAPAGSLNGVSTIQIRFDAGEPLTAGDTADVLVALNPAALRANWRRLKPGGCLILDSGAFIEKNLALAGYDVDPVAQLETSAHDLVRVDMTALTLAAVEKYDLRRRSALRCRNFFAMGVVCWMYQLHTEATLAWLDRQFESHRELGEANRAALRAGMNYGETTELSARRVLPVASDGSAGPRRMVSGNEALSLGLVTAAELSGLDLFLASYPITPASDILHLMCGWDEFGVRTFQAEDEMAAIGAAVGAAYAGALAVTTTSGPGFALMSEMLGMAVALELPMLVVDVQRAGPSTGMPTKPEQSDLNQALHGRSGEAPLPVLAASSASDCFWAVIEAARIALRHMTPVVLLSDAAIANSAESWRQPRLRDIRPINVRQAEAGSPFAPYARDEELARPWAVPGTPGLQHRIGSLEKEHVSGHISYDPGNHELMTRLRAQKLAAAARHIEDTVLFGSDHGDLLVVGWGSTFGAIRTAVARARRCGKQVSHLHLRHLNPLPPDLGRCLRGFRKVLVAEMNLGQLCARLRDEFLLDLQPYSKVQGGPFAVADIEAML